MLCQICGEREVEFPTTLIINQQESKKYICRHCLQKMFYEKQMRKQSQFEKEIIQNVSSIFDAFSPFGMIVQKQPERKILTCNACGRTSRDFEETMLVGCPYCYEAFAPIMRTVIESCQHKSVHVGKTADGDASVSQEYDNLRAELDKAVADERYEDAAIIKHKMEALKDGR